MNRPLLLLAAAVVSTTAAAQTVTTDCYSRKNSVHCRSTYRPSISEQIRELNSARPYRIDPKIIAEGERILAERRARGQGPNDPPNHEPGFQKFRVSQFVAAGDCPGARAYAMATGNPATIARAKEFCGVEVGQ